MEPSAGDIPHNLSHGCVTGVGRERRASFRWLFAGRSREGAAQDRSAHSRKARKARLVQPRPAPPRQRENVLIRAMHTRATHTALCRPARDVLRMAYGAYRRIPLGADGAGVRRGSFLSSDRIPLPSLPTCRTAVPRRPLTCTHAHALARRHTQLTSGWLWACSRQMHEEHRQWRDDVSRQARTNRIGARVHSCRCARACTPTCMRACSAPGI